MIDEKKWKDGIKLLNAALTYDIQRSKWLKLPDEFKSWDRWLDCVEKYLLDLPPEVLEGFDRTLWRINCARHSLNAEDMDGALLAILRVQADCQNARDDLILYERNQQKQKEEKLSIANKNKGAIGAKVRWGKQESRKEVDKIINHLAKQRDVLGDFSSVKEELWPAFFSLLEEAHFEPVEKDDVITWEANPSGITFKTFQNKISVARRSAKK
jgi:hypothetical protein